MSTYVPTATELTAHGFTPSLSEGSNVWAKDGLHHGSPAFLAIEADPEGYNYCSVFIPGLLYSVADMGVDSPEELAAAVRAFAGEGADDCRFACTDEGGCIGPYEYVQIRSEGSHEPWSAVLHYCQRAIKNDRACGYIVQLTPNF